MADRPQSTHSSSTHVSAAESQGPPSHQQWSAYRGPVLFTGKCIYSVYLWKFIFFKQDQINLKLNTLTTISLHC